MKNSKMAMYVVWTDKYNLRNWKDSACNNMIIKILKKVKIKKMKFKNWKYWQSWKFVENIVSMLGLFPEVPPLWNEELQRYTPLSFFKYNRMPRQPTASCRVWNQVSARCLKTLEPYVKYGHISRSGVNSTTQNMPANTSYYEEIGGSVTPSASETSILLLEFIPWKYSNYYLLYTGECYVQVSIRQENKNNTH